MQVISDLSFIRNEDSSVGQRQQPLWNEDRIDAAFRRVRPNFIGFHIWKLENDRIDTVPVAQCGIFNDCDAYIVYAAAPEDMFVTAATVSREVKPPQTLRRFVHFWLGEATSPERSGAVAYKVMELDNQLGNLATQLRESQASESTRFMSYFKEGRIILSDRHTGAAADDADAAIRLFEVRGKVSPTCQQRPISSNWASFSSDATMLLQTRCHVFVWFGRQCSQTERRHGLRMAGRVQRMYDIAELATVDDGYEQSMAAAAKADWNKYLDFAQRHISPTLPSVMMSTNAAVASSLLSTTTTTTTTPTTWPLMKLYKCGTVGGKYRIEEVKTGAVLQSDLSDPTAAFIVDCAGPERAVWIWLGPSSQRKDKAEAMRNARGFVKKKLYDSSTPVVRVIGGHEPPEFRRLFPCWQPKSETGAPIKSSNQFTSIIGSGKFDADTLEQRPRLAAIMQLIDDGSGDLIVYTVRNGTLRQLNQRQRGGGGKCADGGARLHAFFSGDCFVLHYAVVNTARNNLHQSPQLPPFRHIVFVWFGAHSSSSTRAVAIARATELQDAIQRADDGGVMMMRCSEGHEHPQLLQVCGGRLAIFNGSSDDYAAAGVGGQRQLPATYLLKCSGAATFETRAVQVLAKQANITSRDCLVLVTAVGTVWVWCGQSSTGDAREMAKTLGRAAAKSQRTKCADGGDDDDDDDDEEEDNEYVGEYVLALEGSEPDAFWRCVPDQLEIKLRQAKSIGNGMDVNKSPEMATVGLFSVTSNATNNEIVFRQIVAFGQTDLMPEDVFILDAGVVVYVWLGDLCLPSERRECWHIANCYLSAGFAVRSKDTTIAVVSQGREPITFLGHFDEWDSHHWMAHRTVDNERATVDRQSAAAIRAATNNAGSGDSRRSMDAAEVEFNRHAKYPLGMLRDAANLPPLVDPQRKELHLTYDDFVAVFAMQVGEFEVLPKWRKQELKKKHRLF